MELSSVENIVSAATPVLAASIDTGIPPRPGTDRTAHGFRNGVLELGQSFRPWTHSEALEIETLLQQSSSSSTSSTDARWLTIPASSESSGSKRRVPFYDVVFSEDELSGTPYAQIKMTELDGILKAQQCDETLENAVDMVMLRMALLDDVKKDDHWETMTTLCTPRRHSWIAPEYSARDTVSSIDLDVTAIMSTFRNLGTDQPLPMSSSPSSPQVSAPTPTSLSSIDEVD